jgi:hypothetical protein
MGADASLGVNGFKSVARVLHSFCPLTKQYLPTLQPSNEAKSGLAANGIEPMNKGFLHFGKVSGTIWSMGMFSFTGVLVIFGAFVCPSQSCLAQVVT